MKILGEVLCIMGTICAFVSGLILFAVIMTVGDLPPEQSAEPFDPAGIFLLYLFAGSLALAGVGWLLERYSK